MKKLIFLFSLLFFTASLSFAQVKEMKRSMSMGDQNSYSVVLKKTTAKDAEKAWTKFIKDYKGKTKYNKKTKEVFTDNASIKEMSTNTVDIYATFVEQGSDTQLNVWYDLGGAFLSSKSHPSQASPASKLIDDYVLTVSVATIEEMVKTEETTLKKMNGDLKGLEKEKVSLEEDIVKFEKKIQEAKERITANMEEQKNKAVEIKGQEQVLDKVKTKLGSLSTTNKK